MKKMLKFIADGMKEAKIDYHLTKNKKKRITYPYFVGELLPVTPISEDGMNEYSLVVDGFNRESATTTGSLVELLEEAEKIEQEFPQVGGKTAVVGNEAIAVFYCSCAPIDSGDEQLQRVQATLTVKTWKGSN